MIYNEIESIEEFDNLVSASKEISAIAFQNIDLISRKSDIVTSTFNDCLFLGCKLDADLINYLYSGNYIFPALDVPFNCYPAQLYTHNILYDNIELGNTESYKQCYDYQVYKHYLSTGKEGRSIKETLARRLHDHAITDAVYDFISNYDQRKIVAIMGGHSLPRSENMYKKIALLSKRLCELNYLMISGGGPGAMEATHLGAWFAKRKESELDEAIDSLSEFPIYQHPGWLDSALQIVNKFPRLNNSESLGVPTWLYGHEPATPFASKIAKYFANSVREDGLLTIAKGGVIFTPGSAGTIQEIFQDATQNHYLSFGYASPMIFFGKDFWIDEFPVYPFLKDSVKNGRYINLKLNISDDVEEIITVLNKFSESR